MDSNDLSIILNGQNYPIEVKRSAKARSIIISADTIKSVVRLTIPRFASRRQAFSFMQSKSDWLGERFAQALPAIEITNGTDIPVIGIDQKVCWSDEYARKPVLTHGQILVGGPIEHIERRVIQWLKGLARETFEQDLIDYCQKADVDCPRLSVGDARRRWGSCSSKNAIRLSWRLIMAPEFVRRSVVAHEVAHLDQMNHSAAFYKVLDDLYEGDRKKADRWLKDHGQDLHRIGSPR